MPPPQAHLTTPLTVQTALTVPPVRVTLHTREYATAPAILLVAGVLNGGLVPNDALIAQDWNGVPVVINHPFDLQGQALSARSPEVLAQCGVGQVYRARLSTTERDGQSVTRLHAELWLDLAQVRALGGEAEEALAMLETQQALEVSTAFFSLAEPTSGSYHGVPFTAIHRTLVPDHLALLPHGIGACNWAEGGCGAPRLHAHAAACPCPACERRRMEPPSPTGWQAFVSMLTQFVHREEAPPGPPDPSPAPPPDPGVPAADPSPTSPEPEETSPMAPSPAVVARATDLITNSHTPWEEADRPQLEALSETQLARLAPAAPPEPATLDEAIATLPAHLRQPLGRLVRQEQARKAAAIAQLGAQARCPFTPEKLQTLELEELEGLVALTRGEASYVGQGLPATAPAPAGPPAPLDTLAEVVALQKATGQRN